MICSICKNSYKAIYWLKTCNVCNNKICIKCLKVDKDGFFTCIECENKGVGK
jgi:hypothetical protein